MGGPDPRPDGSGRPWLHTPILRPPLPKACPISAVEDKSHLVFSTQLSSHFSGDPPENSGPPYSPGLSTVSPKDFITQFNT